MAWVDDWCPMTDEPAKRLTITTGDFNEYICPSCKRYRIAHSALETLQLDGSNYRDFSGWWGIEGQQEMARNQTVRELPDCFSVEAG